MANVDDVQGQTQIFNIVSFFDTNPRIKPQSKKRFDDGLLKIVSIGSNHIRHCVVTKLAAREK